MRLFRECSDMISELLEDIEFKIDVRQEPKFFTRKTEKFNFKNTMIIILTGIKKDVQTSVINFFRELRGEDEIEADISKQAFLEARKKIKHEAFITINDKLITKIYAEAFQTYKGYQLLAIDGSTLEVPNVAAIKERFGIAKNNSNSEPARGHADAIYDVLNDILIEASIDKYNVSEREQAEKLIESYNSKQKTFPSIYIMDRGYPSAKLISEFEQKEQKFIMRVNSNFLKPINVANLPDQIVEGVYKKNSQHINYKVRVIAFKLPSGETEKLITNIFDETFIVEDFKYLYFKRWPIESKYDILKNKIQIENFSGQSEEIVKQDFYAAIALTNLCSLAKRESDEEISKRHSLKKTNIHMLQMLSR